MGIFKNKYVRIFLVFLIIFVAIWIYDSVNQPDQHYSQAVAEFEAITSDSNEESFDNYLEQHAGAARPDHVIRIEGEDFTETEGEGFSVIEDFNDLDGQSVLTPEIGRSEEHTSELQSRGHL